MSSCAEMLRVPVPVAYQLHFCFKALLIKSTGSLFLHYRKSWMWFLAWTINLQKGRRMPKDLLLICFCHIPGINFYVTYLIISDGSVIMFNFGLPMIVQSAPGL